MFWFITVGNLSLKNYSLYKNICICKIAGHFWDVAIISLSIKKNNFVIYIYIYNISIYLSFKGLYLSIFHPLMNLTCWRSATFPLSSWKLKAAMRTHWDQWACWEVGTFELDVDSVVSHQVAARQQLRRVGGTGAAGPMDFSNVVSLHAVWAQA